MMPDMHRTLRTERARASEEASAGAHREVRRFTALFASPSSVVGATNPPRFPEAAKVRTEQSPRAHDHLSHARSLPGATAGARLAS